MKCRFCWKAQIDPMSGELLCYEFDENRTKEEASIERDCEHYVLCECPDPNYVDFYAEELYIPAEVKVHKDQLQLEIENE